jgi:hypothetical protein
MENLEQDIKYKKPNKNDQALNKLASDTLKYSYGAERQFCNDIYLLKMMDQKLVVKPPSMVVAAEEEKKENDNIPCKKHQSSTM